MHSVLLYNMCTWIVKPDSEAHCQEIEVQKQIVNKNIECICLHYNIVKQPERKKMQGSVMFKINITIITSMRKFTWDHVVSVYYKQNDT